jgi:cytochrome c oxidase assembly protein subunit 15
MDLTKKTNSEKRFRQFGLLTIVAVYLLILVGGIVRSTGSGMGCPDWPKCFGQWIPPTQANELPANYKDIYAEGRHQKNIRLADYLTALGFKDLAVQLLNDKSILIEQDFNAKKTWVEYVNRLIGALIGILIFTTAVASFIYWKIDKTITLLSVLSFLLVGFQGWIGAFVVSTNLLTWLVTTHMLIALLIVSLLIYVITRSYKTTFSPDFLKKRTTINVTVAVCLILSIIQIVMGTQVRENIDSVAAQGILRRNWIDNLDTIFYIHRSFSILVLISNLQLCWLIYREGAATLKKWSYWLLFALLTEILSGVIMAYFAVPAAIQPVHLLFGNIIFGIQFILLMLVNFKWLFADR